LLLGDRIALLEAGKLLGIYTRQEFLETSDTAVSAYRAAWSGNLPMRGGDRHD
jgi:hypothetical protein